MNYGLPYQGSKSKIVEQLVDALPEAVNFYDLFCGGCSVTHRAMMTGKYTNFIMNDLRGDMSELFVNAVGGKYRDEKRWISREEFHAKNAEDAFIRVCWSFGNNGLGYMYGKHIEPYKRACHYVVVFDEWGEFASLCPEVVEAAKEALKDISVNDTKQRRIELSRAVVKELKRLGSWELVVGNPLYKSCKKKQKLQSLESLERLQSLESLESLERLESLRSLQSLEGNKHTGRMLQLSGDYASVEILPNSLVYLDPPYDTPNKCYGVEFDHSRFYDYVEQVWDANKNILVCFSEYSAPEDRFVAVNEWKKQNAMSSKKSFTVQEKLFIPKAELEFWNSKFKAQEVQLDLFAKVV